MYKRKMRLRKWVYLFLIFAFILAFIYLLDLLGFLSVYDNTLFINSKYLLSMLIYETIRYLFKVFYNKYKNEQKDK